MNTKGTLAIAAGATTAAAAGVAVYGGQYPTAQIYGATIHRERGAGKRIALTYDDGPEPERTPGCSSCSRATTRRRRSSSSASGPSASPSSSGGPSPRGHAIGNHTFTHPSMPAHGAARIREELRTCREAVEASGERFSTVDGAMLMRPPYGRRRPGTLRTMRAEGYVPVTWSITGYDWRAHTTAERITPPLPARRRGGHHPAARRLEHRAGRGPAQVHRDHRGGPRALRAAGLRVRDGPGARRRGPLMDELEIGAAPSSCSCGRSGSRGSRSRSRAAWAGPKRLPTWYLKRGLTGRIYGIVMGQRPLTGYHVYAFTIPMLILHLPYVIGGRLDAARRAAHRSRRTSCSRSSGTTCGSC